MDYVQSYYNKLAPRWFRAMRWHDYKVRAKFPLKWALAPTVGILVVAHFGEGSSKLARYLYLNRPSNKDELNAVLRNVNWPDEYYCDWEIDQYSFDYPPVYDMNQRRKKYPQYYGDLYDKTYYSPSMRSYPRIVDKYSSYSPYYGTIEPDKRP